MAIHQSAFEGQILSDLVDQNSLVFSSYNLNMSKCVKVKIVVHNCIEQSINRFAPNVPLSTKVGLNFGIVRIS
jgi:hypothetical protein